MTETQRNQIREKWNIFANKNAWGACFECCDFERICEESADFWLNLIEEELGGDCYCVCHSPVSSCAVCKHCEPSVEIAHRAGRLAERTELLQEIEGISDTFYDDYHHKKNNQ